MLPGKCRAVHFSGWRLSLKTAPSGSSFPLGDFLHHPTLLLLARLCPAGFPFPLGEEAVVVLGVVLFAALWNRNRNRRNRKFLTSETGTETVGTGTGTVINYGSGTRIGSGTRNKMKSQKFPQTQYKIVYFISFFNIFLI
jgi:hypothetical protein